VSELETHVPGIAFEGDNEDLDIDGDAEALRALAAAVERGLSISVGDPAHPDHIKVGRGNCKLVISYDGSALTLAGDNSNLTKLADELRLVARGPQAPSRVQHHVHVDPYPGHPWLAAEGTRLTVWLR
jgi:hypothetical protein